MFSLFLELFHSFWRKHTEHRRFNFVIFANFGVPMVQFWKNPWWVFNPRLGDLFGGALFFSHMGGQYGVFGETSPPSERPWGGSFSPHLSDPWGGSWRNFPPKWGGSLWENFENSILAVWKLSRFDFWNVQFPLQKCILTPQILKNFRLRRAISMPDLLYRNVVRRSKSPKIFACGGLLCRIVLTQARCSIDYSVARAAWQ